MAERRFTTCVDCGADTQSEQSPRCHPCRKTREATLRKVRSSARRAAVLALRPERRCVDCGVDISWRWKTAKRCEAHATARHREGARAHAKAWAAAHPEKVKERIKAWRAAHIEEIKAKDKARNAVNREANNRYAKAYRAANPEKVKAAFKKWVAAHPEKNKACQKSWRARNLEKVKAASRARHAAHPERARWYKYKRLARTLDQLGSVTPGIGRVLLEKQRNRCAAPHCRKQLRGRMMWHLDHIMPLALGGLHDDSNLQVLCVSCNRNKHAKHPDDWLKQHGELPLER